MHPYFSLGPLTLSTFGLLVGIAWLVGVFTFWFLGRQEQPDEEALLDLSLIASGAGLATARVWYLIGHGGQYGFWDWFRIFSRPGLDWQGFLIGFFLVSFRFSQVKKWSFLKIADLLSLALLTAEIIGSLGCHLNGCAVGRITGMPWGVLIAGYADKRHPIALYQLLLAVIFLGVLVKLRSRSRPSGHLFWSYAFLTGIGQTFLAIWRADRVYLGGVPYRRIIWLAISVWFVGLIYRKEKNQWRNWIKTFLSKLKTSLKSVNKSISRSGRS